MYLRLLQTYNSAFHSLFPLTLEENQVAKHFLQKI